MVDVLSDTLAIYTIVIPYLLPLTYALFTGCAHCVQLLFCSGRVTTTTVTWASLFKRVSLPDLQQHLGEPELWLFGGQASSGGCHYLRLRSSELEWL